MHLPPGKPPLLSFTFHVVGGTLATCDLITGLTVLRHHKLDNRTFLERHHASLDCTDCVDVQNNPSTRKTTLAGNLMKITPQSRAQHAYLDYIEARKMDDVFPDPMLLCVVNNKTERAAVREALQDRINEADAKELPKNHSKTLKTLLEENNQPFSTTFTHGSTAKVKPLKIGLTTDSKPMRVKMQNYFQDQRKFQKTSVEKLISYNMVYVNKTSSWASAPLLVRKLGSAGFHFTVGLRLENKFTEKHSFPMPNFEKEMYTLAESEYYANLDFSHG